MEWAEWAAWASDPAGRREFEGAAQAAPFLFAFHSFDAIFGKPSARPERHCHRPTVVTDPNTPLDRVLGRMKVKPERPGDDVIDDDLILLWGDKIRRVITGSDLLGRLLRGIVKVEQAQGREQRDVPPAAAHDPSGADKAASALS